MFNKQWLKRKYWTGSYSSIEQHELEWKSTIHTPHPLQIFQGLHVALPNSIKWLKCPAWGQLSKAKMTD